MAPVDVRLVFRMSGGREIRSHGMGFNDLVGIGKQASFLSHDDHTRLAKAGLDALEEMVSNFATATKIYVVPEGTEDKIYLNPAQIQYACLEGLAQMGPFLQHLLDSREA